MENNVVHVDFTNGFGNNLFQYIYARLIANAHGSKVSVSLNSKGNYAKNVFNEMGIEIKKFSHPKAIKVNDKNASLEFLGRKFRNRNFKLQGYFEDYNLYASSIDIIKSWFPRVNKINDTDLVFHLRLGDRLYYKETHNPDFRVDASQYINAINKFDFKTLHIVTDMQDWKRLTKNDLRAMKFHRGGYGGREIIGTPIGIKKIETALEHFNFIYDAIQPFNPVVRCNCSIADDFNYIRSFDKIMFQHGTISWWASILSEASMVSVYAPWRPQKGKNNKNLSKVDLSTWTSWS